MIDAVLDAPCVKSAGPCQLLDRLHTALEESPYIPFGKVQIENNSGAVRLKGQVASFFEKQMAQEVLRRIDGVERIENLLEVNWA